MRELARSWPLLALALVALPAAAIAAGPVPSADEPVATEVPAPTVAEPLADQAVPVSTDFSIQSTCTASITCDDGQVVSCSASSPETCQAVNSSPPSSCGYVQCGATIKRCTTYSRTIPGFGCCISTGSSKQKWNVQTSCDQSTWYTHHTTCSGPCLI